MKYTMDVKLTGYEQVTVEAANEEEAVEKVLEQFWKIYNLEPASCLRQKTTETTLLGED